jgi:uncharacterized glyoxalase superfamily protein PhnB
MVTRSTAAGQSLSPNTAIAFGRDLLYNRIAQGHPPTETFYSAFHAATVDEFGVHWNVVAEETPQNGRERP